MRRSCLSLAVLFLVAALAEAAPQHAAVRLKSHGASGTIVYSTHGRTLILTCGHAFQTAADRAMPIELNCPHPAPSAVATKAGVRLIAMELNERDGRDLALVEMGVGPMAYVCKVAPAGARPGTCLSIGYDSMLIPAVVRKASITGHTALETFTRESPVPGRSGGGLIDARTGLLVGVVTAFRKDPRTGAPIGGVYVSHAAVLRFLARTAPEALGPGGSTRGAMGAYPTPPAPAPRVPYYSAPLPTPSPVPCPT